MSAVRRGLLLLALTALLAGCDGPRRGASVEVVVPEGAGVQTVAQRLRDRGVIQHPKLFAAYVALRGAEGRLKAGRYRLRARASWPEIADALERGTVTTVPVTIPEGFNLRQIAARLATITRVPADSLVALGRDSALVEALGVPGPTLEGYLFPDTYRFAEGIAPRTALRALVDRYRAFWGEDERARADSLGLSEREVVTLASIVEEEARVDRERPIIAAVYLNRLDRGMRLEADPTVQYALDEPRERLLYRHIRQVADDPYNTYTQPGLPPGPIASPGAASLRAVLRPADVPYLFFVARPDGSHVFSRTLEEHVEAKNRIRASR